MRLEMTDWNLEDSECELAPDSSRRLVCQQAADVIPHLPVKLAPESRSRSNIVANATSGKPYRWSHRGPL